MDCFIRKANQFYNPKLSINQSTVQSVNKQDKYDQEHLCCRRKTKVNNQNNLITSRQVLKSIKSKNYNWNINDKTNYSNIRKYNSIESTIDKQIKEYQFHLNDNQS